VFNVGPLELIVVLIIALIVLGPQRLPDVARSVGRGMREFKSALESGHDEDVEESHATPPAAPTATAPKAPAATPAPPAPEPKPGYQKEADSSEPSSSSRDLV
jgi:sec-independent protein translocase protein TatA